MALPLTLSVATDPAWLTLAVASFNEVLVDHAHCEKKAAANALSLLSAYPDIPTLPSNMARLAREEASHLAQVLALMTKRGLALGRDHGDPYVQALHGQMRKGDHRMRLDKLLVAALVEARSEERLALLAVGLPTEGLKQFYRRLAVSEAGHSTLFVRLAAKIAPREEVQERLAELLAAEGEIVKRLPVRAAIH